MDNSNPALELLERDIAERLKSVCAHMSAGDFDELVHDIARVKLKYGLQSLAGDQLYTPIADAVILARVSEKLDQSSTEPT
jgi:hypothetical protein